MEHAFSRTERLIGEEGLKNLRQSAVMIFGIGGVGSFAAEALARSAVGHLILVDHDDISLTNINRQLHALHSTLGQAKVEVMKNRILEINPQARVEANKTFYSETNADSLLALRPDYVIDAIDSVTSKVSLIKECLLRQIPLISSMGAGNRLTAENYKFMDISQTSGDPLAKSVRKLLRQEGIYRGVKVLSTSTPTIAPLSAGDFSGNNRNGSKDTKKDACGRKESALPGSVSFVPSVVGLLIAGEVVRNILEDM